MTINLDDEPLGIDCPGCGKQLGISVGQAHREPNFTCPDCGAELTFDTTGLDTGLKQANDALADLDRTFGKLGKLL